MSPGHCPCGWQGPPSGKDQPHRAMQQQIHVFWSCPGAAAVRKSVSSAMPPETQLPCSVLRLLPAASATGDAQRSMVNGMCGGSGGHYWGCSSFLWVLSRDCEEAEEELLVYTQTLISAFFPPVAPASTMPVTEENHQATLVRRASRTLGGGSVLVLSK